jgi:hypothetical protein
VLAELEGRTTAPTAARTLHTDLRTASRKAWLAFSMRCPRTATWLAVGVSRPQHPDDDRSASAHSQLTANALRLPNNPNAKSV